MTIDGLNVLPSPAMPSALRASFRSARPLGVFQGLQHLPIKRDGTLKGAREILDGIEVCSAEHCPIRVVGVEPFMEPQVQNTRWKPPEMHAFIGTTVGWRRAE